MFDQRMNLDGDADLERFVAVYDVSSDHRYQSANVTIFDQCNGHEARHAVVQQGRRLSTQDIRGPRALGRPAVLFAIGYGGRTALAGVVGLRAKAGNSCPALTMLFTYSTKQPPKRPPSGLLVRSFSVLPRNDSNRYAGPELVLTEFYGRNTGNTISKRRTFFRFSGDRYVAYRSTLSRA